MSEVVSRYPEISPEVRDRFVAFVMSRTTREVPSRLDGMRQLEGIDTVDNTGQLVPVTEVRYEAFVAVDIDNAPDSGDASISLWTDPTPHDIKEGLDGIEAIMVNIGTDDTEGYYSGSPEELSRRATNEVVSDMIDRLELMQVHGLLTPKTPGTPVS